MSHRLNKITTQLSEGPSNAHRLEHNPVKSTIGSKGPDDIVIVACKRTAIGKAKKGWFKDSGVVEMLSPVLKAVADESGLDKSLVGDIVIGTVLAPGSLRASEIRMASFIAGYPEAVPCRTVNRQCSSGLQAIADVAAAVSAGYYEIGIAGGVESMTQNSMSFSGSVPEIVRENKDARNCLLPMGITSENVAAKFNVAREMQDELAVLSHSRAARATQSGRFKDEIVPVPVIMKDKKTGVLTKAVADQDDGFRDGISMESIGKLRPVFKKGGSTTAGNASQVSDGAAAAIVTKRSTAQKLGLPILGVFRSFAAVGVPPEIMGIGPAFAIPRAVEMAGVSLKDIDLFEINEAFASQATYCVKHLGLSMDNVNVNGGAIAIGHPLGCTGTRMTATLLYEMHKRNSKLGVVSMCIGTGMGAAAVYEVEN